jgi:membrane-associated phospholipid phosphatase
MKMPATKRFISIFLFAAVFTSFTVSAQEPDSIIHERTSVRLPSLPANKNYLSPRSLIVPTAFIVYGFVSLHSNLLRNLNKQVSEEVKEDIPGFKTRADDYLRYAPVASVYALTAIGVKGRHQLFGRTVIFAMSTILSAPLVASLKHSTHQLRPDGSDYNSFPSGHTTTAFIGAEMMHQEFGFRSPWYSIAGYSMATGTALLRIMNNRHWLSDVIAGAGIGMLSTKFCYWVYGKLEKKRNTITKTLY